KTTQPPIAFPRFTLISGELTLFPQIPRYTSGPPDIGYWYPALDYTVAAMALAGGSITVEPGTAVGFRNELAPEPLWPYDMTYEGFELWEGSSFVSHGTPTRRNTFADVQLVQEAPTVPTSALFVPWFWLGSGNASPPQADFRFSDFSVPSGTCHFWAGFDLSQSFGFSDNSTVDLSLLDCNILGGTFSLGKEQGFDINPPSSILLRNSLFDR